MQDFFDVTVSSIQEPQEDLQKSFSSFSYQGVFLYHPAMQPIEYSAFVNGNIKVVFDKESIDRFHYTGELFGFQDYLSQGDLLAMAIHSGLISLQELTRTNYESLHVIYSVKKPKKNYPGVESQGLVSYPCVQFSNTKHFNIKPLAYKMHKKFSQEEQQELNQHLLIRENLQTKERYFPPYEIPCVGELMFNYLQELAYVFNNLNFYCLFARKLQENLQNYFVVFYGERNSYIL